MKLSAKERTSLRAMVEFARRYGEGPVPLSEVARAEELPLPYLEHVVAALRRAGLLQSVRGAHGGYLLTREPTQVRISEVFRAVEGSALTLDCMGRNATPCDREPICATRSFWQILAWRLRETLDSTSLADILPKDSGPGQYLEG
jgi:Rrf2 family cysteine metabolism transcriptional repressor